MSTSTQLLQRLLEGCAPSQLPAPWQRVACHPAFCRLKLPILMSLPEALLTEFSQADLLRARVLRTQLGDGTQEKAALDPCLLREPDVTLALRRDPQAPVSDVFAGMQRLAPKLGPLSMPLRDYRAPQCASNTFDDAQLFVAFSMNDLACLWSLGLPAVLGPRFATATKERLLELFRDFHAHGLSGGPRPAPEKGLEGGTRGASALEQSGVKPVSLTLVDMRLAELVCEHRDCLSLVESHLQKLHDCCDVDLSSARVWQPRPSSLDDLRFALKFGDQGDAVHLIHESICSDGRSLGAPARAETEPQGPPIPTYLDAEREYAGACRRRASAQQLEQKLALIQDAFRREFIDPMLREAALEPDAIRKNDLRLLSDAYGDLQRLTTQTESKDLDVHGKLNASIISESARLQQWISTLIARLRPCSTPRTGKRVPTSTPRMPIPAAPLLRFSGSPKPPSQLSASSKKP